MVSPANPMVSSRFAGFLSGEGDVEVVGVTDYPAGEAHQAIPSQDPGRVGTAARGDTVDREPLFTLKRLWSIIRGSSSMIPPTLPPTMAACLRFFVFIDMRSV